MRYLGRILLMNNVRYPKLALSGYVHGKRAREKKEVVGHGQGRLHAGSIAFANE